MTTINPAEHIIWSADVDGIDTLLGLLDQMPNLTTVKVDRLLLTKIGLEVIQTLNERGLPSLQSRYSYHHQYWAWR